MVGDFDSYGGYPYLSEPRPSDGCDADTSRCEARSFGHMEKYQNNLPESLYYIIDLLLPLKQLICCVPYPINRKESYQPFFIVGSGRSGNTLLRRIFYAHPALHIPPETFVLGPSIRLFRQYRNSMKWADLVYLILSQFEFHPEFETHEISLRPLAGQLVDIPEDSRSLAFILDSLYRYHAKEKGVECKRWGDKTPINTFVLERLLSVFPNAQFIHMIRDGVDVVSSYLQAGIYSDLESAANRWVASIKAADKFARRHPEIFLEVHYETLTEEPFKTVSEICDFLNVEHDPGLVDSMVNSREWAPELGDVAMRKHHSAVSQPISNKSIGRGRQYLSTAQKQQLQELIGSELARLAYEPVTSFQIR